MTLIRMESDDYVNDGRAEEGTVMTPGRKSFITRIKNERRQLVELPLSAWRDMHVSRLETILQNFGIKEADW